MLQVEISPDPERLTANGLDIWSPRRPSQISEASTVIPKTGNAFPNSAANRADGLSLHLRGVAAVM
jgi:hypothetical protein